MPKLHIQNKVNLLSALNYVVDFLNVSDKFKKII